MAARKEGGKSVLAVAIPVISLLIFGSLNTITMKISFTMKSVGSTGEEHVFKKPWFITLLMFVSMSLALPLDSDMRARCCGRGKAPGTDSLLTDIAPERTSIDQGDARPLTWREKVFQVRIAALFDILATGLCAMGFVFLPASVWQLLRGAEMVFAEIFAVLVLKTEAFAYKCLGVTICSSGIVLVGFASVWGNESDASKESESGGGNVALLLLGMGLALGGQVVQAAQVIAEEWLLKACNLPQLQIIGFEGAWGTLMMVIVFFAIYFIPGSDNGRFEDEVDSFEMLAGSSELTSLIILFVFSCLTYNMSGIAVTGALTAVHRVMIEALRTSIVWAFGLLVHRVDPGSPFEEVWTTYSWLEVGGFVLIMLGQATYGRMIQLPFLKYPPAEDVEEVVPRPSPGGMRNMTVVIAKTPDSRIAPSPGRASPLR